MIVGGEKLLRLTDTTMSTINLYVIKKKIFKYK